MTDAGRVGLVLAGFLVVLAGCERKTWETEANQEIPEGPRVGFRAPGFSTSSLDGNGFDLAEQRGRVLLINFWATWCIPCRAEMPSMQRLYSEFGGRDFEILAVSGGESPDIIRPFIQSLDLSFPILLDERFEVHSKYQVTAIPSSYLVDRSGVITNRFFGAIDWDEAKIRVLVDKLIKSKS